MRRGFLLRSGRHAEQAQKVAFEALSIVASSPSAIGSRSELLAATRSILFIVKLAARCPTIREKICAWGFATPSEDSDEPELITGPVSVAEVHEELLSDLIVSERRKARKRLRRRARAQSTLTEASGSGTRDR